MYPAESLSAGYTSWLIVKVVNVSDVLGRNVNDKRLWILDVLDENLILREKRLI